MYIIKFIKLNHTCTLIAADDKTLVSLGHELEKTNIFYKVYSDFGTTLSQKDFCWGIFNNWLEPDKILDE